MKIAALDLGTNTFLCLIAQVENGKILQIYDDQVEVVRLGQDVNKTKLFHPDALKRADQCLRKFSDIISKSKVDKVLAMATSAARDVKNQEELFSICKKYSIPLQIIDGEDEATLTYRGSISGISSDEIFRLVLDIGGGSTELILGRGKIIEFEESLNIGCVRLTEKFFQSRPITQKDFNELDMYIDDELKDCVGKILKIARPNEILAVAGTPTEIARIESGGKFDPEKIDGYELSSQNLQSWVEKFKIETEDNIVEKYGVHPGRADVILVGVLILKKVCQAFGLDKLKVSTRGVRYGVALKASEEK